MPSDHEGRGCCVTIERCFLLLTSTTCLHRGEILCMVECSSFVRLCSSACGGLVRAVISVQRIQLAVVSYGHSVNSQGSHVHPVFPNRDVGRTCNILSTVTRVIFGWSERPGSRAAESQAMLPTDALHDDGLARHQRHTGVRTQTDCVHPRMTSLATLCADTLNSAGSRLYQRIGSNRRNLDTRVTTGDASSSPPVTLDATDVPVSLSYTCVLSDTSVVWSEEITADDFMVFWRQVISFLTVVLGFMHLSSRRNEGKKKASQCIIGSKLGKSQSRNSDMSMKVLFRREKGVQSTLDPLLRRFLRFASDADDSEGCPPLLKMLPDITKQSDRWAKPHPAGIIADRVAMMRCVLHTIRMRPVGPQSIEVRPVTSFWPDFTGDRRRCLQHVGFRLTTLGALPSTVNVFRCQLAEAGFFSMGEGDKVICYCCGASHSGWREGDNPMDIHRRLSPQCEHVRQKDREMAALHGAGATTSGEPLRSEASGNRPGGPVSRTGREASPPANRQAEGGIVSGESGRSRPHPPSAPGATATSTGAGATGSSRSRGATPLPSTTPGPGSGTAGPNLFPQPTLVLGDAAYPHLAYQDARQRTFTAAWDESRAPPLQDILMSGCFYSEIHDCVTCFYCGLQLVGLSREDNVWKRHAQGNPQCGFLRSTKGDLFIQQVLRDMQAETAQASAAPSPSQASASSPPPAAGSARTTTTTTTVASTTTSARVSSSSTAVTSRPTSSSGSSQGGGGGCSATSRQQAVSTRARAGETDSERVSRLQQENQALNRVVRCRICRERPVDTIFMPCGHLILCGTCAPTVQACPLCGQTIRATAHVFMQ